MTKVDQEESSLSRVIEDFTEPDHNPKQGPNSDIIKIDEMMPSKSKDVPHAEYSDTKDYSKEKSMELNVNFTSILFLKEPDEPHLAIARNEKHAKIDAKLRGGLRWGRFVIFLGGEEVTFILDGKTPPPPAHEI